MIGSPRLAARFAALKADNRAGLIAYVMAGDPDLDATLPILRAAASAGADVIELGFPFTDPMADGPTIQRAALRSLKAGTTLMAVLDIAARFRAEDPDTPLILMGYANPIERMSVDRFVSEAKAAGVDGAIVVDYPPEEAHDFADKLRANDMDLIFLLAPTSTDARIKQVAQISSGFSYYVSLRGVTGAAHIDTAEVSARIAAIRQHVQLPIGVGFGIRDAATAKTVASVSDAVVIGSRIIQELENTPQDRAVDAVRAFLTGIRNAIDEVAAQGQ